MRAASKLLLAASLLPAIVSHAPAQGAKPDFKIVEQTKDGLTHLKLEAMTVETPGAGGGPLELTASFFYTFAGGRKVPDPFVTLGFTSRAAPFNYPNFGDAVFSLDGEVLRVSGRIEDIGRGEGTVTSFAEPGVSWVDVLMPLKSFNRIVAADRVEVKIGSLTFSLGDKHLRALREFGKRIPPAKTAPSA